MPEHPPEQERAKEIAERWAERPPQAWYGSQFQELARAYRSLAHKLMEAEHSLGIESMRCERAEGLAERYREALERVLADDGNCTADEPRDSSCPRCQAREALAENRREAREIEDWQERKHAERGE